ncbi:MAG TPA: endonuclease/exonuclease/phosphatase family protein, partial [Methylomirabilota bacterium]|nr:endonuclease/exonuclease/phosphatase family protein [Methylomirabilota bacterium]
MKPSALLSMFVVVGLGTCGASRAAAAAESPAGPPLRVMTFNLRFGSTNSPNSWAERRPVMKACWRAISPDLAGTQEGLYPQLKELAADLPAYDWVGLGRDGGSRGEFMAVFYRKARFEPVEFDHYWLSDTPNVIASTNWGNTNRRMVTWVRFRDRRVGREFYFVNTHLVHAVAAARDKGARLIRQRVQALNPNLPVLLVGDFNAEPGREPTYDVLVGDGFFRDAWTAAPVRRGEGLETFHNFNGAVRGPWRIDWILLRGPWRVEQAEVVVFSRKG